MNLVATAETAQDVASGLNKFLIPVAESSSEITRLISECFAISSLLRDIAAAIRDPRQSSKYPSISEDLRVVVCSIEFTFDDVHRFCGRIVRTSSSAYREVWRCIESHFLEESRNSLIARLEYYKRFLEDLRLILECGEPLDWDVYDNRQIRIDALLEVQESKIEDDFSGLSVGASGASRQRSFERRRPGLPRFSAESYNERRHRPSVSRRDSRAGLSRPQTPLSPLDDDSDDWVPSAPDPPRSPTTTTTFSHSSSSSSSNPHWAVKVFEQSRSTTHFSTLGSTCVHSPSMKYVADHSLGPFAMVKICQMPGVD
ncbi:hypothetical protein MMC31_004155 [Peltigera leucophlebia]|nr:hypothetical protein [Peltigera leucophlebia]